MNWTELNALLKFEISATRNFKRVTAVCGLQFAVYLMLKVSIEQESSYEPNVFYIIQNVINLNAASFTFNLTWWATLHFRTLLQTPNLKGQKPSSVCPFTLHQCSMVRPTRIEPGDENPGRLISRLSYNEIICLSNFFIVRRSPLPFKWNPFGINF